ncbi:MAG TPA: RecX family transcriptional regulator [Terriglobales bacterium]|nr:RecX family transcriptional regulator [Terriglobales bacterium]
MPRAPAPLDADGLYEKAVRSLAQRGRSESELRRRLGPRAASAGALEAALARLRDHGYLDDARLAQSAAAHQKEGLRHGRARALRELQGRGLANELAQAAVAAAYAGENEDALLRAYVKKKRLRRPEELRQAASLYRKLRLAGFSAAACQRCLRAWRVEAEWVEGLEEE